MVDFPHIQAYRREKNMTKVNLKKKPYYLEEEAVKWVEDTIHSMTIEEKIGQLFVNMGASREESYLKEVVTKYKFGAVRYNPGTAVEVWEQNRILQENSKIPLLIAANTEAGGNGACTDGTEIGLEVKIGATNDPNYAYEVGRVSGIEAAAVGCNWSFAPITDINRNWRNPIISARSFGNDPNRVLEMSKAYMKGFMESNMVCAMKHFPGDGIDERDQHLSNSVNTYSCEEWDDTFGKVYAGMIEAGVHTVMAGHIMMPAYEKEFCADWKEEKSKPATLSKELITDLLKGKLGFNGMVVTDASHMVGMTSMMKRSEILPASIAAGCDMFLFYNDPEEDLGFMMDGYQNGVITEERLQDALERILGVKAYLGLNKIEKQNLVPPVQGLSVIGSQKFQDIAKEVSDKAVTLVKNIGDSPLPISPQKYHRVLLIPQETKNPLAFMLGGVKKQSATEYLKDKLVAEGFEVSIYESTMEKMAKLPSEEAGKMMLSAYAGKAPITNITDHYDLMIQVANVNNMFGVVQRISWQMSKGTPDIPWYVHEIPTIFVSVSCPFHLADVPQVKTYINCYDRRDDTLDALVEKLMGRSEFMGIDPVDSFCGMRDTRW